MMQGVREVDFSRIKPYGDTLDDGAVQLSFTLPVPGGARAAACAEQMLAEMGFQEASVVHQEKLGSNFTFIVAYGKTSVSVDFTKIEVVEVESEAMTMEEVDDFIRDNFSKKLVVIGACTGDDAHTVGIDAIMNMKGYNHHYGLERYSEIEAYNLGSQVPNEDLITFARNNNADAILVSQIVTQKETHVQNLTNFIELAEVEGIRDKMVLIVGGPRIDHRLALELGFDAGFGPGTYAEDVASFIVHKLKERSA